MSPAARGRLQRLRDALRAAGDNERRIADLERELVRVSPQLAALEERVEQLAARLSAPPVGEVDDAQLAEARSLVDEVRAEHARVRARITAATVFEERLRVLESRLGVESETGRDLGPDPD